MGTPRQFDNALALGALILADNLRFLELLFFATSSAVSDQSDAKLRRADRLEKDVGRCKERFQLYMGSGVPLEQLSLGIRRSKSQFPIHMPGQFGEQFRAFELALPDAKWIDSAVEFQS